MALAKVSLDDKYDLGQARIYASGAQAVARLLLTQHELDRRTGLNTAGYVSGYRGSPLGGLDLTLIRARKFLLPRNIIVNPAINEDLAATAIWGSQQAELRGEGNFDGVFGLWYGKGPGVDRSGDVFRHANHAGASRYGGVIALMGDDHTCESSTSAHQSEFAFIDAMMPVLNPAGVQEILDYGLYGWALSRFSGLWVGLKCVKDNIEQTAVIDAALDRVRPVAPGDFALPPGGLNIRLHDAPLEKEARLYEWKLPAALAFARANGLDRVIHDGGAAPEIGIATTGKSYLDVAEALHLLGIDKLAAARLGLRLYKVAMPWPLEPEAARAFARGLRLVIVVEEKRGIIEPQFKELLYRTADAPAIIGKTDEEGRSLFPAKGALDPVAIAIAIGERLAAFGRTETEERLRALRRLAAPSAETKSLADRIPYFCAGCPHNSSTIVPEGARAYAGIGCHYMVQWMDRSTEGFTQMGGEGANWLGEAPFSKRGHIFQNIGDGTFVHSGSLAIRAAVASGANITFKLLYNDAVAMTGGQPIDGGMTVEQMAAACAAEGVKGIAVVSDEPQKYVRARFPHGATFHHRDDLDMVQRTLSERPGTTVLIYDQTCAAEKRRRRKRGQYPDPPQRVFINELVCEGCGDCGMQSNCVAIVPVETEFGRKRAIDQSACNKDFSCLKGFCPSFVTVTGGRLKKPGRYGEIPALPFLPAPPLPTLTRPRSIVITGVGGTGVVTLGSVLGMAAHLEGKGVGLIDMSGLAQKGGPVAVHVRIGAKPGDIAAIRASAAGADAVIGVDLVVTSSAKILGVIQPDVTRAVVNTHMTMTADFTRKPSLSLPFAAMRREIETRAGKDGSFFLDAHKLAIAMTGDAMAANTVMLGAAYQMGLLPVSAEALKEAIRLNGVDIEANLQAFDWGRAAIAEPALVERLAANLVRGEPAPPVRTLQEAIGRRAEFLTGYQDAAYAARYRERVAAIERLEAERCPGKTALTSAVARAYFQLLAYKDEYEVARLYADDSFRRQIEAQFEGDYKLQYHLAPPLLSHIDPATGRPRKRRFGPWMRLVFRLLAHGKRLRGTKWDIFGRQEERKFERALIREYEDWLDQIERRLNSFTYDAAVKLAEIPLSIKGFGPVKREAARRAQAEAASLLEALEASPALSDEKSRRIA